MIECLGSGLIYRHPKPHVRSVQAYFPSVVIMENGDLLATLVLGRYGGASGCPDSANGPTRCALSTTDAMRGCMCVSSTLR